MDKPHNDSLEFSLIAPSQETTGSPGSMVTGTIVDITETGMRILSDTYLKPGSLIKLSNDESSDLGVVMWTLKAKDKFKVKVRFL